MDLFATTDRRDPAAVLHDVFGHREFRGQQEAVVRHVTGGGDAVVLFPTGAGKSMCYQIPAMCRHGVGVVISPLIALMRDQVEALKQAGVAAAALNSSMSQEQQAEVVQLARDGALDLLYVAPERLAAQQLSPAPDGPRYRALCDRRGALREPVGPRLPARSIASSRSSPMPFRMCRASP